MANIIEGVKKLSSPVFIVFVASKILVGIGLGVLLVNYLASYGLLLLIVGVVLSAICAVLALKNIS